MSRLEFYGFPAWVGTITSSTECAWWATDPSEVAWDPLALISINVTRTPSAALAGTIKSADIEVDDHTTQGGRNTIGPLWPGGAMIGGCWLRDTRWQAIDPRYRPQFPSPNASGFGYEYTTVQYLDGEQQNRRFYGFHARAVSTNSKLTLIELWNPGTGAASPTPAGSWWLDLAAVADPNGPRVDPANTPLGPVFLEQQTAQSLQLFEPKFPRLVGSFPLSGPLSGPLPQRAPPPLSHW
jgi:hypothetical protein